MPSTQPRNMLKGMVPSAARNDRGAIAAPRASSTGNPLPRRIPAISGLLPSCSAATRGRRDALIRYHAENSEDTMAKEELLEFEGKVIEVLPDGNFRVKLDNDHEILAYTAGKMRKFRIRTGVGDRVIVEMSPYDLQRGRISFRHKSAAPPMIGSGQRRPNYRRWRSNRRRDLPPDHKNQRQGRHDQRGDD